MRLAVAFLLAFFPQEPPTSELVADFLKGSAPAREALLKRGPDALLHLLEARRLKPDLPRVTELNDLLFDLQEAAAGERGKAAFQCLRNIRLTIDLRNAPLAAVLDYLREVSGLDIVLDPAAAAEKAALTITLADLPFGEILRTACARSGMDYDFRHGVLFVAPQEAHHVQDQGPDPGRNAGARHAAPGPRRPDRGRPGHDLRAQEVGGRVYQA